MDNNGLPPNIPPEALPDADFVERIQRLEAKNIESLTSPIDPDVIMVETPVGPVPMPKQPVETHSMPSMDIPKKDPEPIVLEYRFSGDCPKHFIPVSTLTTEFEGRCLTFAFCRECNKNVYEQVAPIIVDKKKEDTLSNWNNGTPIKIPRTFKRRKVQK